MSAGTKQVVMYKYCVIFLAILASPETLVCDGRPIKSMKPFKPGSFKKESIRNSPGLGHQEEGEGKYNKALAAIHNSIGGAKDDFRPIGPDHSLGVGHTFQNQLENKYDSLIDGVGDDFKPTYPGHSLGIGHPRNFVTGGGKNDFRSTGPGRSPGVGHLVEEDKHSSAIAGDKDDFRPTDPGHSPGIGHH